MRHRLAVSISSGANVIGALRIQQDLPPAAVVVTILCDSNKKYLSTDLLRSEPVKDGYLTSQVEMLGFDAVNRVCEMCADPRTSCARAAHLMARAAHLMARAAHLMARAAHLMARAAHLIYPLGARLV